MVDQKSKTGDVQTRTTCPRDCYDTCGMIIVKQRGVMKVLGDPDHPVTRGALCSKCAVAYNGIYQDSSARLTQPLLRVGKKGQSQFRPIGWDEAIDIAATALTSITRQYGAEKVIHTHYTGTRALLARDFPLRFFNRLGATEIIPDTICNISGQFALEYIYGTALTGFDPRTAKDSSCIVVWGANPSASAPHAHKHWLPDSGAKIVVVDPVRHATAQMADLYLQLYPGTDAALAFSILHVLHRDALLNTQFIEEHVLGWDRLVPEVARCTPEWGEYVTGVPKAKIEQAALLYASGPALLWIGMGLQRQRFGGNVVRAVATLPAVTGNLGRAGAGFFYINGSARRRIDPDFLLGPHLRKGPVHQISHMDLVRCLEDPLQSRALFCWNINIAASSPQQGRLRQALGRADLFMVALDLFPTDTVDYADLVLPAASFLEFDDLLYSYFHLNVAAQVKVKEPEGQALPNQEIFRRLSRAMNFEEPELFESDEHLLNELMERTGLGLTFTELSARGSVYIAPDPILQFADLKFATASGRIELASARAEADGHPLTPLPISEPQPTDGRLRLISPAGSWLSNSAFANDAQIGRLNGPALVYLHPRDAADRGLRDGDEAELHNDEGAVRLKVSLSEDILRGTALAFKNRWPKLQADHANINILNAGEKSDMGEGTAVHSTLVNVRSFINARAVAPGLSGDARLALDAGTLPRNDRIG